MPENRRTNAAGPVHVGLLLSSVLVPLGVAAQAPASGERWSRAEIQLAESGLSPSPTIDETLAAAISAARLEPERVQRIARRARHSAWLPLARLGIRRGLGRDYSSSQTVDAGRTNDSFDDDFVIRATLTFRLDRLAFSPAEALLLREEDRMRARREELVTRIASLYFDWRRLRLLSALRPGLNLEDRERLAELAAVLRALTGLEFSAVR